MLFLMFMIKFEVIGLVFLMMPLLWGLWILLGELRWISMEISIRGIMVELVLMWLVWERLDHALSNGLWRTFFPWAATIHFPCIASDHSVFLLDSAYDKDVKSRPFRFLEIWLREKSWKGIIVEAWDKSIQGYNV